MSGATLKVDRLAAGFWSRCAIAAGMNDRDAALECCREAGEIEQAYELRLKTGAAATGARESAPRGSAQPSGANLRRIEARFAGRCAKCSSGIAVGSPIAYDPDSKRAFHDRCAP